MAKLAERVHGEHAARALLTMFAEPADAETGHVLARVGGIETLRLLESDEPVPGMDRVDLMHWRQRVGARLTPDALDRVFAEDTRGYGLLIPGDKDWPAGLDDLGDRAPYALWARGATSLLRTALEDRVTITGARAATAYGERVAQELAIGVADTERVAVSGGAYGIDGAVHKTVLAAAGHTVAVMPSGLDRLYPTGHSDLLNRVADTGLLVSEMPPGSSPTKWRFMARSRLLAALSGATVIVEAGYRSGSLHVVTTAANLGRGVGAVPGPVTSTASAGTHRLLREGLAKIVTDEHDLTALLTPTDRHAESNAGRQFGINRPLPQSNPSQSF